MDVVGQMCNIASVCCVCSRCVALCICVLVHLPNGVSKGIGYCVCFKMHRTVSGGKNITWHTIR